MLHKHYGPWRTEIKGISLLVCNRLFWLQSHENRKAPASNLKAIEILSCLEHSSYSKPIRIGENQYQQHQRYKQPRHQGRPVIPVFIWRLYWQLCNGRVLAKSGESWWNFWNFLKFVIRTKKLSFQPSTVNSKRYLQGETEEKLSSDKVSFMRY